MDNLNSPVSNQYPSLFSIVLGKSLNNPEGTVSPSTSVISSMRNSSLSLSKSRETTSLKGNLLRYFVCKILISCDWF